MNLDHVLFLVASACLSGSQSLPTDTTFGKAGGIVLTAVGGLLMLWCNRAKLPPVKAGGPPAPPAGPGSALFIMLALSFGISSCATVKPVVLPIAKHCGQAVSADVLPAIESALVAQDYVVELTALAVKFGTCVVNDAVKLIQGEAIGDLSFASADVNSQILVQHATAWLTAHPE